MRRFETTALHRAAGLCRADLQPMSGSLNRQSTVEKL